MKDNEAWRDLVSTERAYYAARKRLLGGDPVAVLGRALGDISVRRTALRMLMDVGEGRPDLVDALLPQLLYQALWLNPDGGRARQVLRQRGGEALAAPLAPLIRATVTRPDVGYEEYHGLTMLLDEMRLTDLLDEVLAAARASADLDIREVAEAFESNGIET